MEVMGGAEKDGKWASGGARGYSVEQSSGLACPELAWPAALCCASAEASRGERWHVAVVAAQVGGGGAGVGALGVEQSAPRHVARARQRRRKREGGEKEKKEKGKKE